MIAPISVHLHPNNLGSEARITVPDTTVFLTIQNAEHRIEYAKFRRHDFPSRAFGVFIAILTIAWYTKSNFGLNANFLLVHGRERESLQCSLAGNIIFLVGCVFPGWLLFVVHILSRQTRQEGNLACVLDILHRWISVFESSFVIFGTVGSGLFLISMSLNPDCRHFTFWGSANCNIESACKALPQDQTLVVFLCPLIFQAFAKSPHFLTSLLSWLLSVGFVTAAVVVSGSSSSGMIPIYSFIFGLLIYEIERRELAMFVKSKQLSDTEHSAAAQKAINDQKERQAAIFKKLIINLTHDFLTPIQALEIGLETMLITPSSGTMKKPQFQTSSKQCSEGISNSSPDWKFQKDLLESMKSTLAFMSMMVRRCVDVFELADGKMLKPTYEVFNYPLVMLKIGRCVSEMQSRVRVTVIVTKRSDKSYIETDKRWLEDNILCLLSNAVKYSSKEESSSDATPVSLRARVEVDAFTGQSMLTVEVTDSGEEMWDADRAKLFARPDQTGRIQAGGAGLGLFSLSKRVEALGGTVGSRKRTDGVCCGSVMWFTIPMSSPEATSPPLNLADNLAADSDAMLPWESFKIRKNILRRSIKVDVRDAAHDCSSSSSIRSSFANYYLGGITSSRNSFFNFEGSPDNDSDPDEAYAPRETEVIEDPHPEGDLADNPERGLEGDQDGDYYVGDYMEDNLRDRSGSVADSNRAAEATSTQTEPQPTSQLKRQQPKSQQPKQPPLRVLVVDDSVSIMKIMSMSLTRAGHTVKQATNGAIALEMMKKELFDAVLMDIQMPVMGGYAAARLLREFERSSDGDNASNESSDRTGERSAAVPAGRKAAAAVAAEVVKDQLQLRRPRRNSRHQFIVGMSANTDVGTRADALESGMDAFLPKPFALDAMMELVKEYMDIIAGNTSPLLPAASAAASASFRDSRGDVEVRAMRSAQRMRERAGEGSEKDSTSQRVIRERNQSDQTNQDRDFLHESRDDGSVAAENHGMVTMEAIYSPRGDPGVNEDVAGSALPRFTTLRGRRDTQESRETRHRLSVSEVSVRSLDDRKEALREKEEVAINVSPEILP